MEREEGGAFEPESESINFKPPSSFILPVPQAVFPPKAGLGVLWAGGAQTPGFGPE